MTTEFVIEFVTLDLRLEPDSTDPALNGTRVVRIEDTILVRLPKVFWFYHEERDLISGNLERENKDHIFVRLDLDAYDELLSDAQHYANFDRDNGDWAENAPVCSSAVYTVKALKPSFGYHSERI